MATYLLTGATGFLGGHLLRLLLAQGDKVVVLSRRPLPDLDGSDVLVVQGDILDQKAVTKAARGCDGLFHCAGLVSRDPADSGQMLETHVQGTIKTLDGAKAAGVKRVVYLSTSGTVAIREDDKEIPNEDAETPFGLIGKWGYYRSKLYAEDEALKRNGDDFQVVSLNPSLLLGPGDIRGGSTQDIRWFLQQKIPALPSGGLSFVDVRDVAQVALTAMAKGTPGERYLLGACNHTFAEHLRRLSRLSGVAAPTLVAPKHKLLASMGNALFHRFQDTLGFHNGPDEASLEMARHFWYLDASKAQRELDFAPRDPLETLRDTLHDMQMWDPALANAQDRPHTVRMRYHLLKGTTIDHTGESNAR